MKRIDFRGIAVAAVAIAIGAASVTAQTYEASKQAATDTAAQVALPEVNVMPYEGIGPVVMGSVSYLNLPHRARRFLDKHCDGASIVRCDKVFTTDQYELSLADGIEMAFSKYGDLVEIDAPTGYSLSPKLVKAILPKHTYKNLKKSDLDMHVGNITHDQYGYRVYFNGGLTVNEVLFNNSGDYIASYE